MSFLMLLVKALLFCFGFINIFVYTKAIFVPLPIFSTINNLIISK